MTKGSDLPFLSLAARFLAESTCTRKVQSGVDDEVDEDELGPAAGGEGGACVCGWDVMVIVIAGRDPLSCLNLHRYALGSESGGVGWSRGSIAPSSGEEEFSVGCAVGSSEKLTPDARQQRCGVLCRLLTGYLPTSERGRDPSLCGCYRCDA